MLPLFFLSFLPVSIYIRRKIEAGRCSKMGSSGFLSLQIENVVGPPLPRHRRPPTTTTLSLPFSAVLAINNDASPLSEIQSKSRGIRRRRRGDCGGRFDRMSPRSFQGEDFWGGGDGDEGEDGKLKGWSRKRRMRDGWKWRRRRRYSDNWTDSFWLFKVLRPYGWSLPPILLSWLAASGPKAFFISLALLFALSVAALVVQLLWPGAEFVSQGRSDSERKRRSMGRLSRGRMPGGKNDEKRSEQKHASAYDSWLEDNLGPGLDEPSFGGWFDLEEERFPDESEQVIGRRRKGGIESGKESREPLREAEAEAPLLLRLLVAMFPFVASWTRFFW